ncbi:hypothetical protein BSKO_12671 [Bryopsis sp. KO-2023]|nr:hypothetical protein BSKO_12671 [Bryopsis sp. KO-2023]
MTSSHTSGRSFGSHRAVRRLLQDRDKLVAENDPTEGEVAVPRKVTCLTIEMEETRNARNSPEVGSGVEIESSNRKRRDAKFLAILSPLLGNNPGFNEIHEASYYGNVDALRGLLDQGADIEEKSRSGAAALYLAAQEGHLNAVKFLLDEGADIETRLNSRFSPAVTPLIIASENAHLAVVKELIARGADIGATNNRGLTVLQISALAKENAAVLLTLIDAGADVDAEDPATPLWFASFFGNEKNIEALLSRGANETLADADGLRPKDAACGCFSLMFNEHLCNIDLCKSNPDEIRNLFC